MSEKRAAAYFTFGQDHMTNYPLPGPGRLADFWVTVDLPEQMQGHARSIFIREFTERYCPRANQFAFQYEECTFKPEYFPGGELCRITEGGLQKEE